MTNHENRKGNRARLTRKLIDKAQADHVRGKRVRLWDTDVPQLYVQITPGGSASYYIRYPRADGSKNDFRLCAASIPPEDARRGALQRLAALQLEGIDPAVERRDDIAAAKRGKVETARWRSCLTKPTRIFRRGIRGREATCWGVLCCHA